MNHSELGGLSTRSFRYRDTSKNTFYPRLLGTRGAVTSQNYLAAEAGVDVLKAGGNAVDAMVSTVLVEGVTNPHMHTLGGEVPLLIKMHDKSEVIVVNGNMVAPAAATPEAYRSRGFDEVPDCGVLAAGVPAALSALILALKRFGTMDFSTVATAAIDLARHGFPVHAGLVNQHKFGLAELESRFRSEWQHSGALYLPADRLPRVGESFKNEALARVLEFLCDEERAAGDRTRGLAAVHDAFYKGDIAAHIDRYCREREGLLARADLERFSTWTENPVHADFYGVRLFKCGPWNQGPAMLACLRILEATALENFEHNSAEYLHLVVEAIKLAYADREQYFGDPRFVDVPIDALMERNYAGIRAALIDPERASDVLRPGDPRNAEALLPQEQRLNAGPWDSGTVHVDVIDRDGNMVAATPSGAWIRSQEVVPELGFPLGNRLMTFYLEPDHHPNIIAPGKQPRTTISPSLAFRHGEPWMVFGSMGGDQQDQWQLQFILNRVLFNMTLQEAIEAPKLSSEHFPGFFSPHEGFCRRVRAEASIAVNVLQQLRDRGHEIDVGPAWSEGFLLAAERDAASGIIEAGCDPRGVKAEVFSPAARCW